MNYPVRCTSSISLLKNCRKTRDLRYFMTEGEMYVEAPDITTATTIGQLNGYMEGALRTYRQMLDEDEKGGAI